MKKLTCKICGETLSTHNGTFKKHIELVHRLNFEDYLREYHPELGGYCKTCGKPTNFKNLTDGFRQYCSRKCISNSNEVKNKRKKTCMEKYGVENVFQSQEIQEKIKQINLEKYGVENVFQSQEIQEKIKQVLIEKYGVEHPCQSKEIQEKMKQTMIEKYGVKNAFQSQEIQEKIKQINLEKHGVEYPGQSKEIRDKQKQTCLEKYGVENPNQSKEIQERAKQTNIEKYGVEYFPQTDMFKEKMKQSSISHWFSQHLKVCKWLDMKILETPEEWYHKEFDLDIHTHRFHCNIHDLDFESEFYNDRNICPECITAHWSKGERELGDYIESLGISIIRNDRIQIKPKEIDIWIPSKNIGIEYNGIYWHKDLSRIEEKTNLCKAKGIKLIHIWDYEWEKSKDNIKTFLKEELYEQCK